MTSTSRQCFRPALRAVADVLEVQGGQPVAAALHPGSVGPQIVHADEALPARALPKRPICPPSRPAVPRPLLARP